LTFVALLISIFLGVAVARRGLGILEWSESIPLGIVLAQLFLLFVTNATLRTLGWSAWAPALGLSGLALAALVAGKPAVPLSRVGRLPGPMLALAVLSLLVTLIWQCLRVDDDYWAHTPFQGQLSHGYFPLRNPFFPEIEPKGHYGRDLLVVVWARLTGATIFSAQYLLTATLQPTLLVLAYWAFRRQSQGTASALSATMFLALGAQVCGRCGLLTVWQNNNAVLHTWWALTLYAFVLCWQERNGRWAGLLGMTLGSFAIVYETHFVLCSLASLVTFGVALSWLPGPLRPAMLRPALIVLITASALAWTQGGPLTDLAARLLQGWTHSAAPPAIGLTTQNQHVELRFPKEKLFQVRCRPAPTRWEERTSPTAWVYRLDQLADPKLGYAPLWDRSLLDLHSLPLYLSPLLLVWALHQRQLMGLWLVCFGMVSFSVPGLVDFGPVFESEYYRWEFAAGLGCAAALGLAVGPTMAQDLARRRARSLLWLLFLIYSTSLLRSNARDLWAEYTLARQQGLPTWYWSAHDWVTRQPILDFHESDWRLAQWLEPRCQRGETVVVSPLARSRPVAYESTLLGLTGLLGNRRLPLDTDGVGLVPSRQRADVACFFASGDPAYLDLHLVHWAVLRPPLQPIANPQMEWTEVAGLRVGCVQRSAPDWPTEMAKPLDLKVTLGGLPDRSDEGKVYPLTARYTPPPGPGRLVVGPRLAGPSHGDPQDRVPQLPHSNAGLWMAPYQAGDYLLECFWWDSEGLHPVPGEWPVRVDTLDRLRDAQVESVQIHPSGKADGWCQTVVRLRAPLGDPAGYLGGLVFLEGASQNEALQPLPNWEPFDRLQKVELRTISPGLWEFEQRTLLPPDVGHFRVDAFLSPFQGAVVRLRGKEVVVTTNYYRVPHGGQP
jgi:hypothetical protein